MALQGVVQKHLVWLFARKRISFFSGKSYSCVDIDSQWDNSCTPVCLFNDVFTCTYIIDCFEGVISTTELEFAVTCAYKDKEVQTSFFRWTIA